MAVTQKGTKVLKFAAQDDAVTGILRIRRLYWYAPTTIGHKLMVKDTAGSEIWPSIVSVANQTCCLEFSGDPLVVNGLKVTDLDSGTLYVYLK